MPFDVKVISGLEWLQGADDTDGETAIGRLLLVDREAILVNTLHSDTRKEQAIFGQGFDNGLIVIARRLMATGLMSGRDPATR